MLLLSDDGKTFSRSSSTTARSSMDSPTRSRWRCGSHGQQARLRAAATAAGKSYFHLDEVEIYAGRREPKHRLGQAGRPEQREPVVGKRHDPRPAGDQAAELRHGHRVGPRAQAGRGAAGDGGRTWMPTSGVCGRWPRRLKCLPRPRLAASQRDSTSTPAGPCGGWPWPIRCWISTRSFSSSGPRASSRTCPTSSTAGGRGRAAGSSCWRISRAASRRVRCLTADMPEGQLPAGPISPTTASGCSSPIASTIRSVARLANKVDKQKLPEDCFYTSSR